MYLKSKTGLLLQAPMIKLIQFGPLWKLRGPCQRAEKIVELAITLRSLSDFA